MKKKTLVLPIAIVLIFYILFKFVLIRNAIHCELKQGEIRPKLKSIIGKELPETVENLRAVIYSVGKNDRYVELFVAFHTDPNGCSYVLKEFDGPDVKKLISFQGICGDRSISFMDFERGYRLQEECGAVLFDIYLIRLVKDDYSVRYAITGKIREGAPSGNYIYCEGEYEPEIFYKYHVLIFTDRGLVYIYALKKPEGLVLP